MIFIDNKYTQWYYNIINRAKDRLITGYTEKHHIIPKSFFLSRSNTGWLDGDPEILENKVCLTSKEHFLCHLLLIKMTTGVAKIKMSYALARLSTSKTLQGKITSRTYEYVKKMRSIATSLSQRGVKEKKPMSKETREKISQSLLGKKLSEETKSKQRKPKSEEHRKNMMGRYITKITRQKLSNAATGRIVSDQTRAKQSVSAKNRPAISEITRKKLSNSNKGKQLSDQHKQKLSLLQKNLPRVCCLHCGYEVDVRNFHRFHNISCNKKSRK
jgi:hypothetical protein